MRTAYKQTLAWITSQAKKAKEEASAEDAPRLGFNRRQRRMMARWYILTLRHQTRKTPRVKKQRGALGLKRTFHGASMHPRRGR